MGGCRNRKGNLGNLGNTKNDMECWKCGYKGQIQVECRSKTKKKGWQGKKGNNSKKVKDSSNIATEGEKFAFTTKFARATLAHNKSPIAKLEVNRYDSSASSHMSPTRRCFVSLTQISPSQIKAADQTLFTATAMGKLQVSIPNEKGSQSITLGDILYCLDLAYTLISLS